MKSKRVLLEIKSCYEHIPLVSRGLIAMIERFYTCADVLYAVELCVVEVSNNAVEHAYHNVDEHLIKFELEVSDSEVTVVIIDSGETIPQQIFDKDLDWDALDKDDMSTWQISGRGLQIVKDLMDEVFYWTESGLNYFKMVKKVPK